MFAHFSKFLLVVVSLIVFMYSSSPSVEAMPCKTRIIYKTVHVPVHIIKKVPVIKEVKVPVYIKSKHHHEGGHHEGHKMMGHMGGGHHGGGGEHGGGGFGEF